MFSEYFLFNLVNPNTDLPVFCKFNTSLTGFQGFNPVSLTLEILLWVGLGKSIGHFFLANTPKYLSLEEDLHQYSEISWFLRCRGYDFISPFQKSEYCLPSTMQTRRHPCR